MSENKETFNQIMNMEIHTLDETSMNNVSKMWCFIEKQNEEISELKDRIEYWKKEALNDFSESNEIVHEFSRANKRIEVLEEALRYPEKLPSDIYDLRDYFGEWCELSRQALAKSKELKNGLS